MHSRPQRSGASSLQMGSGREESRWRTSRKGEGGPSGLRVKTHTNWHLTGHSRSPVIGQCGTDSSGKNSASSGSGCGVGVGTAQLSAERLGCWVEEVWIRKKGDRLQRADKADGTVEMRGKSKCTGNTAACVVTTTTLSLRRVSALRSHRAGPSSMPRPHAWTAAPIELFPAIRATILLPPGPTSPHRDPRPIQAQYLALFPPTYAEGTNTPSSQSKRQSLHSGHGLWSPAKYAREALQLLQLLPKCGQ